MKNILLLLLMMMFFLDSYGQEFSPSFDKGIKRDSLIYGNLKYMYNPPLKFHPAKYKFSDGRNIYYHLPMTEKDKIGEGGAWKYYDYPKFSYAVINYPELGTFYGIIEPNTSGDITSDYKILFGILERSNGVIDEIVGTISLNRPVVSGKYQKEINDYYSSDYQINFSKDHSKGIITLNFLKGGILKYNYNKNYTLLTPQEIASEAVIKRKVGGKTRYRSSRQLTGGWYFDVKASNVQNGKWHIKDGKLLMSVGKAIPTITTKLNTERLIEDWKKEYAMRFMTFKMDDYHSQYLQQCRSDYPNFQVDNEKESLKEHFREYCSLPTQSSSHIILADNENLILRKDGGRDWPIYRLYRKNLDNQPLFDEEDIAKARQIFAENFSTINNDAILARNHAIAAQLMQCDLPEIKAATHVYFFNLSDDLSGASAAYTIDRPGENKIFRTDFKINGISVDRESVKATNREALTLKRLFETFEENETRLKEALNNKKNKEAKKQAKKYFKEFKSLPKTHFSNSHEYNENCENLKVRIKAQEAFLNINNQ